MTLVLSADVSNANDLALVDRQLGIESEEEDVGIRRTNLIGQCISGRGMKPK